VFVRSDFESEQIFTYLSSILISSQIIFAYTSKITTHFYKRLQFPTASKSGVLTTNPTNLKQSVEHDPATFISSTVNAEKCVSPETIHPQRQRGSSTLANTTLRKRAVQMNKSDT